MTPHFSTSLCICKCNEIPKAEYMTMNTGYFRSQSGKLRGLVPACTQLQWEGYGEWRYNSRTCVDWRYCLARQEAKEILKWPGMLFYHDFLARTDKLKNTLISSKDRTQWSAHLPREFISQNGEEILNKQNLVVGEDRACSSMSETWHLPFSLAPWKSVDMPQNQKASNCVSRVSNVTFALLNLNSSTWLFSM